jgi:hypothetical protein
LLNLIIILSGTTQGALSIALRRTEGTSGTWETDTLILQRIKSTKTTWSTEGHVGGHGEMTNRAGKALVRGGRSDIDIGAWRARRKGG